MRSAIRSELNVQRGSLAGIIIQHANNYWLPNFDRFLENNASWGNPSSALDGCRISLDFGGNSLIQSGLRLDFGGFSLIPDRAVYAPHFGDLHNDRGAGYAYNENSNQFSPATRIILTFLLGTVGAFLASYGVNNSRSFSGDSRLNFVLLSWLAIFGALWFAVGE